MYVCVCNVINDRQVKQALNEGVLSVRALRQHFAYPEGCCGKCHRCLREMINEHLQAADCEQGARCEACAA
jgi:Bacterioferritin-associated ferredoxin